MKLEVGKYYQSEFEEKWKCVHFQLINSDDKYNYLCVTNRGKTAWFDECGNSIGNYKLISEWVEPVAHEVNVYFAETMCGNIIASDRKFEVHPIIAKVKVSFTEGEGL